MNNNITKFHSEYLGEYPYGTLNISEIQRYRILLQEKSLIGVLKEGQWVGYDYGNISLKMKRGILISSSQTSGMKDVYIDDFTYVVDYDKTTFTTKWYGKKPPSSETPLHWFTYEARPESKAVIHGHIIEDDTSYTKVQVFFKENGLPLTQSRSKSNEIGEELSKLIRDKGIENVIGMNNHDGGFGLIAIDKSFKVACEKLLEFYERVRINS